MVREGGAGLAEVLVVEAGLDTLGLVVGALKILELQLMKLQNILYLGFAVLATLVVLMGGVGGPPGLLVEVLATAPLLISGLLDTADDSFLIDDDDCCLTGPGVALAEDDEDDGLGCSVLCL